MGGCCGGRRRITITRRSSGIIRKKSNVQFKNCPQCNIKLYYNIGVKNIFCHTCKNFVKV